MEAKQRQEQIRKNNEQINKIIRNKKFYLKHKVEDGDFYEQKTAPNTIKHNKEKKLQASDSKSNFGSFTTRNNNMTMLKTESKKNILDY